MIQEGKHFWSRINDPEELQCLQSSLSQNGGDNLRHHCSEKFQTTLKMWMGRLQLLPKIFETVLRPIWWAAGTEQPSPPLHRATAAQLLSWSGALQLLFFGTSISWTKSSCISHWANHISAGGWPMHCSWFLPTPIGLNCWCTHCMHSLIICICHSGESYFPTCPNHIALTQLPVRWKHW